MTKNNTRKDVYITALKILDNNTVNPEAIESSNNWKSRKGPWGVEIVNLLTGPRVGTYIVPNPREFVGQWYWDTMAIILGILRLGDVKYKKIAYDMVSNLFYLFELLGLIPNAGDSVQTSRSQPPFLSSMINELWEHYFQNNDKNETKYTEWLIEAYKYCKKEYIEVWCRHADTMGFVWFDTIRDSIDPESPSDILKMLRPESRSDARVIRSLLLRAGMKIFPENPNDVNSKDINRLQKVVNNLSRDQRQQLISWLHSRRLIVASGMDFSACYGINDFPRELGAALDYTALNKEDYFFSAIEDIVPVDLNALLFKYTKDCLRLLDKIGQICPPSEFLQNDRMYWQSEASRLCSSFENTFWCDEVNRYCNFNKKTGSHLKEITHLSYLAYPLWAGIPSNSKAEAIVRQIKELVSDFGLRMSLERTGNQWDWNMWPLQVWITIQGLNNYNFHDLATNIAQKYISCVDKVFIESGSIYEKYNAVEGSIKTDGRYPAGRDFSWGASIYIALLAEYGHIPINMKSC